MFIMKLFSELKIFGEWKGIFSSFFSLENPGFASSNFLSKFYDVRDMDYVMYKRKSFEFFSFFFLL